ncbi:MAG: hypothetical protein NT154_02480 [Verrucomicrobia bacterium]|nr:hypothetical protein [Verrucomicrobiota bacterium]
MTNKYSYLLALATGLAFTIDPAQAEQPDLNYNVHRVRADNSHHRKFAPVIDGVISPGEWSNAGEPADDFTLMRQWPLHDNQPTRFRMLWDDQALYILGEIDYGGWKPPTDFPDVPPFDGSHDCVNIYFSPRPSALQLFSTDPGWCQPCRADGYQIAWHIDRGFARRNPVRQGDYKMGLFLEAHTAYLFGDQANWYNAILNQDCNFGNYADCVLPGLQIAQNAGPKGCVFEMRIAWAEFNAPDGTGVDGTPSPLYHPFAPTKGDQWAFEWGQITTDPNNFLPSWSDRKAQALGVTWRWLFAQWPHGTITFKGEE